MGKLDRLLEADKHVGGLAALSASWFFARKCEKLTCVGNPDRDLYAPTGQLPVNGSACCEAAGDSEITGNENRRQSNQNPGGSQPFSRDFMKLAHISGIAPKKESSPAIDRATQ